MPGLQQPCDFVLTSTSPSTPSLLQTLKLATLHHLGILENFQLDFLEGIVTAKMSKSTSLNGSESEFEFVETPKATPPSFDKEEKCGVRTTKVNC
jgi:hypothetical protein